MVFTAAFIKNHQNRILAGIILLALILRIPFLFESIWMDESLATKQTIGRFGYLLWWLVSTPITHAPAFFSSMYLWINVFGDSEISIRTPPLLYGLASIFLIFKLCEFFKLEELGIFVTILLCFSPVHVWYSTEARSYSGSLFWVLLTIVLFLQTLRFPQNNRTYWAYSLSFLVLCFSHLYTVVFTAAFLILVIIYNHPNKQKIILATLIPITIFATYIIFKLIMTPLEPARGHARAFTLIEGWLLFFNWYSLGNTIWALPFHVRGDSTYILGPTAFLLQSLLGLVFANGVYQTIRSNKQNAKKLGRLSILFLIAVPTFLYLLTKLGYDQTYLERATYTGLPFFLLLLGFGAFFIKNQKLRYLGLIFLFLTSLTSYGFLVKKINEHSVYQVNEDWRSAARFLKKQKEIDPRSKFVTTFTLFPISYYEPELFDYWQKEYWFNAHALFVRLQGMAPMLSEILEFGRRGIESDLAKVNDPPVYRIRFHDQSWERIKEEEFDKLFVLVSHFRIRSKLWLLNKALKEMKLVQKHQYRKITIFEFTKRNQIRRDSNGKT